MPGCAHHVTQRGNRQATVFRENEDRLYYMKLLREQSLSRRVLIWAYTVMLNHIHAVVVPQSDTALSETFRDTHATYGNWFNRNMAYQGTYGRAGSIPASSMTRICGPQ
jgi:putative transposase